MREAYQQLKAAERELKQLDVRQKALQAQQKVRGHGAPACLPLWAPCLRRGGRVG